MDLSFTCKAFQGIYTYALDIELPSLYQSGIYWSALTAKENDYWIL